MSQAAGLLWDCVHTAVFNAADSLHNRAVDGQLPPFHQQEPGASSEPVLLPVLSWFDWRAL